MKADIIMEIKSKYWHGEQFRLHTIFLEQLGLELTQSVAELARLIANHNNEIKNLH